MTVKELIKRLESYDPDATVALDTGVGHIDILENDFSFRTHSSGEKILYLMTAIELA